jgi:beta-glucosidase/6-phospho-beta-glucosidase/beta-galactosidase
VDASGNGEAVRVGIVMNMTDIVPSDAENALDVQSAEHMDYLYHRLYIDALTTGAWDPNIDMVVDETRADLAGRIDLLGINYYNEVKVIGLPIAIGSEVPIMDFYPEFSWDPHPEGLGHVVTRATDFGLPILITENGTPYVEEEGVEVLDGHLTALYEAIQSGADVEGYLYWSFIDNYEWNHGFDLRFGLYALDSTTKERTPRAVRDRLTAIAETNQLNP